MTEHAVLTTEAERLFTLPPERWAIPPGVGASPFFKWVGGKSHLLNRLACRLPTDRTGRYWEPFLGGASLFFAVGSSFPEPARLSDVNSELIVTFRAVRDHPHDVISALRDHQAAHSKTRFERIRDRVPDSDVERAARFLYLNKTCYNGVYRVNGQNRFNSPYAATGRGPTVDGRRIHAASTALSAAVLTSADFGDITPQAGDVVYCDPPYDGCYDKYTADGFTADDQERLADAVHAWADNDVFVMVSNSDTPLVRRLYADCYVTRVPGSRRVNSDTSGRKPGTELIITTYEHPMWATDRFEQMPLLRS